MKTNSFFSIKAIAMALMFIIWISNIDAQETGLTDVQSSSAEKTFEKVLRINLTGFAGFNFEEGIGGPFSISYEAGLGFPLISNIEKQQTGAWNVKVNTLFNPYIKIEGRCYYNLDQRKLSGKQVSNFSANFLSVYYKYQAYGFANGEGEAPAGLIWNVNQFGLMWGMQRNLGCNNGMYFNFAIGPSIRTNLSTNLQLEPTGYLGFGFQW